MNERRRRAFEEEHRIWLEQGGEVFDAEGRALPPPPPRERPAGSITVADSAAGRFDELQPVKIDGEPWWRWEGTDTPSFSVCLRIGRVQGRLACTGLHLEAAQDGELTARDLRELHLPDLLTRFAWSRDRVEARPATRLERPGHPGPRGHSREHFEQVAALYREALEADPYRPVAWMRGRLDASPATLRRWIQRARDMGLLGPAPIGRAGDASEGGT